MSAKVPIVIQPLSPLVVLEGEAARLSCRIIGNPKPRVIWTINGVVLPNGSRYKIKFDGIYQLEIPKCCAETDNGEVRLEARNAFGCTTTSAMLTVRPRNSDYRAVLQHSPRAFYDDQISRYQRDRQQTELFEVFEERPNNQPYAQSPGDEIVWYTEHSLEGDRFKIREQFINYVLDQWWIKQQRVELSTMANSNSNIPSMLEEDNVTQPRQLRPNHSALINGPCLRPMNNDTAVVANDEQIIQRRGRRVIPKTPTKKMKSPRKRSLAMTMDESNQRPSTPPKTFNSSLPPIHKESPFTKCLRGIPVSPPPRNEPSNFIISSLKRRLLSPTNLTSETSDFNISKASSFLNSINLSDKSIKSCGKFYYYSPTTRKLRSSDTPLTSSSILSESLYDSGIDLTPMETKSTDADILRPIKTIKIDHTQNSRRRLF
ncbi:hypothetical protein BLOT_012235 [Blomia tropicalis]|nr:hypothetical protein BLOT_012235 [Blomia tropicalis]